MTKPLRGKENRLFITTKKPFKPICSQTISHWLKKTLEKSGVDITIFIAHSTRHAATSGAFAKGVNIDIIRKTAGWSRESQMFAKAYNRPIIRDKQEFARAILTN